MKKLFRKKQKTRAPGQGPGAALLELLYPSTAGCPLCGREVYIEAPGTLCASCREKLRPVPGPLCPHCGRPALGGCCHGPYASEGAAHALLYTDMARKLEHRLKYGNAVYLADYASEYLAGIYENAGWPVPDAVVPVPLSQERLKERGYNQSELLAAAFCRRTGLALRADWLSRVRNTTPQVGLDREKRVRNLKGAFKAEEGVRDRVILLMDDVFTTGSTTEACALALKEAGAKEVYIECLCAAIPQRMLP